MPKCFNWMLCFGVLLAATPAHASTPDPWDGSFDSGPPRGTYLWTDADSLADVPVPLRGGEPHVLYLNRCQGGLTISSSNTNDSVTNQSTVGGGSFPEFSYGDQVWNQVVDGTRQLFAPYNILVTDVDPSPAPHDEAIVCGGPGVMGFPNGVGGVAPFTCGQIPNAITFTFAAVYGGDVDQMVATIGQEAAHAWGLEHLLSCNDPMTYLNSPFSDEGSCWPKSFQNKDSQCGEYNPRSCDCGGNTQNSDQHILDMFGSAVPDTQAPVAAVTAPTDGSYFAVGAQFDIEVEVSDDVTVTQVRLFNNDELQSSSGAPFGPWPASNIPEGTYALHIEAEDGAGNVTTSEVVTIYVTEDGMAPEDDESSGGDEDGIEPTDETDGSDSDAPADDDSDDDDDGDTESGGLPPGFGMDDPDAAGCACDARGGESEPPWVLGWLGLFLGASTLRRRRSPGASRK